MRRVLVAVTLIAVFITARAGVAAASAPQAAGWWWEAEQGAPVPAPPTVPAGGFMVGADPSGTDAVAALRFELSPDETSPIITLSVASNGAVNDASASITASRAAKPWTAAAPGNWSDRPTGVAPSVQGVRSADGTTWTFNVGALLDGTTLDIVFEPDPSMSFQVAFNAPNDQTLRTSAKPPVVAASPADTTFDAGASNDATAPSVTDAAAVVPTPVPDAGSSGQEIALDVKAPQQQGNAALASPALPGPKKSHEAAGLAFVLVLGVLVIGWALSRQPAPALRALGPISTTRDPLNPPSAKDVPAPVGGLGRFARPRVGPPPKL